MPGPDPEGLSLEEGEDGRLVVVAYIWRASLLSSGGNRAHRLARARAVQRNIRDGGWPCRWCGDPVPLYRRADAIYCCEGCRKRAARRRRQHRKDRAP